ncbi:MAG: thioredoxin [Clostridia bacterium]|nr:thioredoxin [Clostridia bacterium]
MKLATNLKHIVTADELRQILSENENVMVCCGRMGPMCIPVYATMEELESEYENVAFYDMAFDSPEAGIIKSLPECRTFRGLPFTVYYKNGQVVKATASIQTKEQITTILNDVYEG